MSETHATVAIFYASADVQFALRLIGDLQARGLDVDGFDDLIPGADTADVVARFIEEHNILLVVISPAAAQSAWMARVGTLLAIPPAEKALIVARIGLLEGDVPPWLQVLRVRAREVDFTADYDAGLRRLLLEAENGTETFGRPYVPLASPPDAPRGMPAYPPPGMPSQVFVPPPPPAQPAAAAPPSPALRPRGGIITGSPTPSASETIAAMPATAAASPLENVEFTAFHPREISAQTWQTLLFFLSTATDDARAQVAALAAEQLRERLAEFRAPSAPAKMPIARGTQLTIVPHVKGIAFDPALLVVRWTADVQSYSFNLRAEDAPLGHATEGFVDIFQGPILRAAVPISLFVLSERKPAPSNAGLAPTRASAYRNTFPSYARRDERIVRAVEAITEAGGDRFLRDVRALRAGEQWASKLLELIESADVFQLFWSKWAARSEQVEREWRHALKLLPSRPGFIRPIYWERQLLSPPKELQPIDFGRLETNALGLERGSLLRRLVGLE